MVLQYQGNELDGRRLRREHNREAVLDALSALFREGVYQPGLDEVALRAGLSPRSLFRYFDNVDDLLRAAITRQLRRARPLLEVGAEPQAPTAAKIERLVHARARLFEEIGPAARATRASAHRQPVLAKQLRGAQSYLRHQVGELFAPELEASGGAELPGLVVLCSFEAYELLRFDQGLSRPRAMAAMTAALSAAAPNHRRPRMKILRTPDERFTSLPDFPFQPHYVELGDGIRVHYLDEGPADVPPVLLIHGEPSWSFLYRTMIPVLVAAGHRCVVPDLVGFGRSDKPSEPDDYSYQRHVDWMGEALFERLALGDITFFGQDWGGLVGLRLVAAQPGRFARVVVANTGLPTGDRPPNEAFLQWQQFARESPTFPVGAIISGGCAHKLTEDVVAAYDAPFPDDAYKAGARSFPSLVPTSTADPAHEANTRAWEALRAFDKPFLCAFSDGDPITRGGARQFVGHVAGAAGQPHTTVEGGGHFLQEDRGVELAQIIVDFIATT